MSNSGLGTSEQTLNVTGGTNNQSTTNPWPAAIRGLKGTLASAQAIAAGQPNQFANTPQQDYYFNQAYGNLDQLPNFGPAAAQAASNFLQTGGDPTGILRRESADIGYGDPQNTPGMKNVLDTIKNDVSNQINGQFAGAGRSLSGLNTQTLARGISQGEAVPLLNQYNQNIANQLGIQGAAVGNIGQGFNYANMAPGLATAIPQAQLALTQQQRAMPYNLLGLYENLINPIAGLGGTVTGTQQTNQAGSGTATNSILSQLGQGAGLISPIGGLLGTIL